MQSLQLRSKTTRRVLTLGLLILAGTATVQAAERHLKLVQSAPANAATLAKAPQRILLTFSQKPNLNLTRVAVTDQRGNAVATRAPTFADTTGKAVTVPLPELAQGTYNVSWRTLARDGHKVAGKLSFTVDSTVARRALSARR
jgi:methionine-rich copper-binding protein CopC